MVELSVDLDMVPMNTPDAEFRIQAAWRILAVMVLEVVGRDSEQAPVVLPQESLGHSLPDQNTSIVEA